MTKKIEKVSVDGKEVPLPEGARKISEDGRYAVPLDKIRFAERGSAKPPAGKFIWYNYRHVSQAGLDDESMSQLAKSIRENGLLNAPVCRWRQDDDGNLYAQLLAGERRIRAIRDLVAHDKKVYSPVLRDHLPASEVYETVPCLVLTVDDDIEALGKAWDAEERSDWGDGPKTKMVADLRAAGIEDDDILRITRKGPSWLREEDVLGRLAVEDETTFQYYDLGRINRSVALRLTKVQDLDERHRLAHEAFEEATKEYADTLAAVDRELARATDRAELARAEESYTEETAADPETKAAARNRRKAADEVVAEKAERKKSVTKKGAQAKTKHVETVLAKDGAKTETPAATDKPVVPRKVLSAGKINTQWKTFSKLNRNGGRLEKNDEELAVNEDLVPVLPIVEAVLGAICNNNPDIIGAINTKYKNMLKKRAKEENKEEVGV